MAKTGVDDAGVADQRETGVNDEPESQVDEGASGVADQEDGEGQDTGVKNEDSDVAGQEGQTQEDDHEEVVGLKRATQSERFRRQLAERENAMLKQRLAEIESKLNGPQEGEKLNPDDWVTVEQFEKLLDRRLGNAINPVLERQKVAEREKSEAAARKAHTDYDDVVLNLTFDMIHGNPELGIRPNPGYMRAIEDSEDQGETAYKIGMLHPMYAKRLQKAATKKVADKIKANAQKPATSVVSGHAGNKTRDEVKQIQDMSDEEFEAYSSRIKMR